MNTYKVIVHLPNFAGTTTVYVRAATSHAAKQIAEMQYGAKNISYVSASPV